MRYGTLYILVFSMWAAAMPGMAQTVDPGTIEKELNTREAEQRKLDRERKRLELQIQSREHQIQKLDKTLRIYEINIQEAQQVIDAAQYEIDELLERASHRDAILQETMQHVTVEPERASTLPEQAMRDAITAIAASLMLEQEEEAPRLNELEALVAERKAYQERIRTRYMPADAQKKESQATRLETTQVALTTTADESKQLESEISKLRENLEISQRALEQLAREREEARQRELERQRKATPTVTPLIVMRDDERPVSQLPRSSGTVSSRPFSQQQGSLAWPARGKVVQPFGTFTHHRYKVSIDNTGIDVQVSPNTPLRVGAPGTVFFVGDLPGIGPTVIVEHNNAYVSVYGNIKASVAKHQRVGAGDGLGRVISPSGSDAAVYHFAIMKGQTPVNPILWLQP